MTDEQLPQLEHQSSLVFPDKMTFPFRILIDEGEEKGIFGASIEAYNLKEARRAIKFYYPQARAILVLVQ